MIPFSNILPDIARSATTARNLDKLAEFFKDDREVLEKIAEAKVGVVNEMFNALEKMAFNTQTLLKGLGYASGAAIPTTLAGSYLINRLQNAGKEMSSDLRNKALQAALAAAAVGAGLYGLNALSKKEKKASDQEEEFKEITKKLASVGWLDATLGNLEQFKGGVKKIAAELKLINREYGMKLLGQLI